jgi:hypothetical protein
MKRLTADEYLAKIRAANTWTVQRIPMTGEVQLTVLEDDEPVGYLGPDPICSPLEEISAFMYHLEVQTMPSATVPDLTLPCLDHYEFIREMNLAREWTVIHHVIERRVELIVLTADGRFRRYLSYDISKFSSYDEDLFLATIAQMIKEK